MSSVRDSIESAYGDERHKGCADALLAIRDSLASRLVQADNDAAPTGEGNFIAAQAADRIDMLVAFMRGQRELGQLYVGTRIFELSRVQVDAETNRRRLAASLDTECGLISEALAASGPEFAETFLSCVASVTAGITDEPKTHVHTLFVGDCLHSEIGSFLAAPMAAASIGFDSMPVNARTPRLLHSVLEAMPNTPRDVVFFSPFSHERLPEIGALLDPKKAFRSHSETRTILDSIVQQTKQMLDYLSDRFECPIYIHNASLTQRAPNALRLTAQELLTARTRGFARQFLNEWLAEYIKTRNANTHPHLILLDEDALAVAGNRRKTGLALHDSPFQHAVRLSQRLADAYRERLSVIASLKGRKLVVCDLDHTLWHGVIGEGAVQHAFDRQRPLKALREHGGIVLSIASKNDPRNVHFDGGLLALDDFVAAQINWGSKAQSIERIRDSLNLQTKHMVFLDDRPDERLRVSEAFPEILVMDATQDATWRAISLWAELTHGTSEVDRTQMYRDREARAEFTGEDEGLPEPDEAILKGLDLRIDLRIATSSDLSRLTELTNRTNQWNLSGTRTTLQEVEQRHNDPDHLLVLASVRDRFGDMGTVAAAIVDTSAPCAEIRSFVMSCRVFGYGIETAVLSKVTSLIHDKTLAGYFIETNVNHIAKAMYQAHGFEPDAADPTRFVRSGKPQIEVPDWLVQA